MTDGFGIFYRRWRPQGETKRVLLGLHGAGGHSGGFLFLGNRLAEEQGTDVYAIDRRGFGNSVEMGYKRGNLSNFKRYLQDIDDTCNLLRTNNPGKKFFIYGHSEGALHARHYAASHPGSVDGLILASPGIKPKAKPSPSLVLRVLLLRAFSPNTLIDSLKYSPKDQRESKEIKLTIDDPLVTLKFSARYLYGASFFSGTALSNANAVQDPTLILQGDSDNAAMPEGAQILMDALAAKDKTLTIVPGAGHLLMYDPSKRDQVISAVRDWLEAH